MFKKICLFSFLFDKVNRKYCKLIIYKYLSNQLQALFHIFSIVILADLHKPISLQTSVAQADIYTDKQFIQVTPSPPDSVQRSCRERFNERRRKSEGKQLILIFFFYIYFSTGRVGSWVSMQLTACT